jgi:hypothetical protein
MMPVAGKIDLAVRVVHISGTDGVRKRDYGKQYVQNYRLKLMSY